MEAAAPRRLVHAISGAFDMSGGIPYNVMEEKIHDAPGTEPHRAH
jgi:hypothetical protein